MIVRAAIFIGIMVSASRAIDLEAQTSSPWNPFVTSAVATELAERARRAPLAVKPLVISSLGNYFSVVGRFVGNATVFEDSIIVDLDTLVVTRVHHGGPVQVTRLDSIRLGVGVGTRTSWSPVDKSGALQVERVMPVGSRIGLSRSRFVIPHTRAEDDDAKWIVVIFHLTVGRPGERDFHPDATTYAHSDRGILSTTHSR